MSSLLRSEKMNYCNTACASDGEFNIYYKPNTLRCFSINFEERRKLYTGLKSENAEFEECVLMYNNKNKTETHSFIEYFAYKLYNLDRNIDININACKTPVIAYGNDKNLLTIQNILAKYQGNEPLVIVDKQVAGDINKTLQVIDLKPQYYAEKLQFQKEKVFNEALTYLGINNISLEKKERLNQDEANSNNEMINLMLNAYLQPREEAIKQFNDLFNQNVEVVLNSDLENTIKKVKSQIMDFMPLENDNSEGKEKNQNG